MLTDQRVELPAGAMIDKVAVVERIASGGLALVYRGRHPRHGEVIIKEFYPHGATRRPDGSSLRLPPGLESDRQDFRREAYNLDALKRRVKGGDRWRVPILYAQFEANETLYLILEMISGESIDQHANRRRREGAFRFAQWVRQTFDILAEGLEAFQAAGILHGDVTPDNLRFADGDGRPTFIDFGSAYHRKDYRTMLGPAHPSYRPPAAVTRAIIGGGWVDVHGLCSTFHFLLTRKPPFEAGALPEPLSLDPRWAASGLAPVVSAIDRGMVLSAEQGIIGPGEVRAILATDAQRLSDSESASVTIPRAPTIIRRNAEMANLSTARNQSCLLQSFDTPRFRIDDGAWLKRTDGSPLITSLEQKVALARAEALLAICYGREIVVPAGQVADSPGFEEIFNEVYAAYGPRQKAIKAACERLRVPEWRPFRLGIERADIRDYVGFTQSYRYTGADMVLLKINDESVDKEKATAAFFEQAVRMFGQQQFAALGTLMLTAAKRENFEPFARNLHAYFDPSASVVANPDVPEVSTSEYASLFRSRLEDAQLSGRGLELAREALEIVTRIESDLTQHDLQGFRGNWYIYRKKFENTWPLARAYLDFRLFMNLARLYDVDHPIFVSQAFEYGVFDHSLFLGPKFSASSADDPDREVDLLKLAACTTKGVNWDEVLEMFLDDTFLRSIRLMNRSFFSSDPDEAADYPHLLRAHATLLAHRASTFLRVDVDQAIVGSKADASATQVMIDAVDSVTHPHAFSDGAQSSLTSVTFGTGAKATGGALVAIAPVDGTGNFNLGDQMADQMLNYYIKPYRMLINRDA